MDQKLKQRVDTDNVFVRTQTQSLSRNRNVSEADPLSEARDPNTAKLKELRLQKEALDREAAASAPPKSKARKRRPAYR